MPEVYTYVWEYFVQPSALDRFEALYGPSGDWVQLFRRAEGYLGTELLRDNEHPGRYLTIDHWASKKAHDGFRASYTKEFDEIDERGEALTEGERFLGSFSSIGHAVDR